MTDPALSVSGVSKARGANTLWSDLSFDVAAGQSIAIWGRSGSGKSTLLDCLGLVDRFDAGSLRVEGDDVTRPHESRRRALFRGVVAHLRQDYGLEGSWTVDRNLDLGLIGSRISRSERARRRSAALDRVGLAGANRRRAHTMSGGEQQRVALARLLLRRPRIVLADEPSSALDAENAGRAVDVLDELRNAGAAIVVVTHDVDLASWCDSRIDLGGEGVTCR
ncbi:putative ABC transport system ATP-binding protein [Frondihabitans sp. PhB188]|uniref:ATP-binding cassette domain-containing protein n=1 Tax=Frondihabitans sp. PhB188 TaxID=2485200 RepID=UPI000F478B63|nr:ATP-binding cassette domain-containing protein [Frondihabitans sp. PhB188]ROQ38615.1 putative ABC transport system ATP-binding protein [Frondihabitans sp. PhB188]